MPAPAVKCRSMLRRPASAFYRSCSRQSMGVRARGWGYTRVTWENVYILTDSRRHGARSRRSRGRGCGPHPLRVRSARSRSSRTVIAITTAQVLKQTKIKPIISTGDHVPNTGNTIRRSGAVEIGGDRPPSPLGRTWTLPPRQGRTSVQFAFIQHAYETHDTHKYRIDSMIDT
jgi:hypothetical protein